MVWECVSAYGIDNSHIWKGPINPERLIQVLQQHMLRSKSISWSPWAYGLLLKGDNGDKHGPVKPF